MTLPHLNFICMSEKTWLSISIPLCISPPRRWDIILVHDGTLFHWKCVPALSLSPTHWRQTKVRQQPRPAFFNRRDKMPSYLVLPQILMLQGIPQLWRNKAAFSPPWPPASSSSPLRALGPYRYPQASLLFQTGPFCEMWHIIHCTNCSKASGAKKTIEKKAA